ncbi:MAG: ATP-grasp domain-containing protein [Pseudomonadales bacterium]|nr:ATP-grasp domain-containing protein [Pseudomonadales bacterium]
MKSWHELNVAITGMNNRPDNPGPGYAIARCLHELPQFRGRIIGLGYDALDGGLFHRDVCHAGYLLPYPSGGEEPLLARLLAIHEEQPFDVLIPALDSELLAMSRLQGRLATHGIQMLLPSATQIAARSKDHLPELCEQAGVQTPPVRTVSSATQFHASGLEDWGYPLVVKGVFYDAQVVHQRADAMAAFSRISAQWGLPVLVQPWIEGVEFNLAGVGDGLGGLYAAVMMRKQAVTEKGKAWAGMSVSCPPLLEAAQCLVKNLQWRGPLEVEMLRDREGQFHLIEINPRFPAWIYLSEGCGLNLPQVLLRSLAGNLPAKLPQARAGHLFIRYAEELVISLEDYESMVMRGSSTHAQDLMLSLCEQEVAS